MAGPGIDTPNSARAVVFSGRPNVWWALTNAEADRVRVLVASMTPVPLGMTVTFPRGGYRRTEVVGHFLNHGAGLTRVRAFNGFAVVNNRMMVDQGRTLENFVLARAPLLHEAGVTVQELQ